MRRNTVKLLPLLLLLSLLLCGCSATALYPVVGLFSGLGKGSDALYQYQDYRGQGEDDYFSPGAP